MRRQGWHRGAPPPWWPANERWPPRHMRPWRGPRRFFIVRIAAVFAIVLILSGYGAVTLLRSVFGGAAFHPGFLTFAPLLLLVFFVLGLAMRRVGRPLGDVVNAADQVASGDFGVRIREHGPPWLRSVAAAFNSMTARLEVQRRQRQDLMADIAHELRTPLAAMQGRLEGMLDGVYPRDERQVGRVLEETRTLARLVEDLRTLAHSESGTLRLAKEPTDVNVLIDETIESCQPEAIDRGITLRNDAVSDLPLLDVDPVRLREVLANLASNAIRYAASRAWVEAATSADAVTIRMKNDGPGVAPDQLPHVFDRFYKGPRSSGSGLGLTIARNLVIAHGGTLTADSEPDKVTTMTIALPRHAAIDSGAGRS